MININAKCKAMMAGVVLICTSGAVFAVEAPAGAVEARLANKPTTALVSGSNAQLGAQNTPNAGCLGACGNRRHDAEGWCGHCSDHCEGGSESECTDGCNNAHNWRAACDRANRENPGGHPAIGHFCSETGHGRQAIEAARNGCLAACGGRRECRSQWCDNGAPARGACYAQVRQAYEGCANQCRPNSPRCVNTQCLGVLLVADCDGHREAVGFCVSFTGSF